MIEAYAFLAAFAIQVLVISVLYPAWFIRYVRLQATSFPAERLAHLYPGVDLGHAQERFLTQYRALTTSIAVLGLLLLGWLFSYVRRPDWDDGPVEVLVTVYFLAAQMLPLFLVVWLGVRFNKEHKRSLPEGKRTAILQRRGLFDFVSPFVVFLAVLSYLLFAAFVKCMGIYPVGTLLRLKSGRLGVVIDNSKSLLKPVVKVFFSAKSMGHIAPQDVDLSLAGSSDEIASREDAGKWQFGDISRYWATP